MIKVSTKVKVPLSRIWEYWNEPVHITQWNAAADTWHCPEASNDLQTGGKFSYRMEAKDGSMGFELSGRYGRIEEGKLIESTFDDGRRVITTFQIQDNGIIVVSQSFDPDGENPEEPQPMGWQGDS